MGADCRAHLRRSAGADRLGAVLAARFGQRVLATADSRTGTSLLLRPVLYRQARPFRESNGDGEAMPARRNPAVTKLGRS